MLLAYPLFSDKTHHFGAHTAPLHPLIVYLPQAGMKTMRTLYAHSYLALLPQVSPKHLGMPLDRKQRTAARRMNGALPMNHRARGNNDKTSN